MDQVDFRYPLLGGVEPVMITSLLSSWSICCVGGLWWRPLSLLFKSKLPDILFNILCTGYDLRLRMRRFFIQQAQARRW